MSLEGVGHRRHGFGARVLPLVRRVLCFLFAMLSEQLSSSTPFHHHVLLQLGTRAVELASYRLRPPKPGAPNFSPPLKLLSGFLIIARKKSTKTWQWARPAAASKLQFLLPTPSKCPQKEPIRGWEALLHMWQSGHASCMVSAGRHRKVCLGSSRTIALSARDYQTPFRAPLHV